MVKGAGLKVIPLSTGLLEDFERFFHRCRLDADPSTVLAEQGLPSFDRFYQLFVEEDLYKVYAFTRCPAELRELEEQVLLVAFSYFIFNADGSKYDSGTTDKERTERQHFGILLTYCLYHAQPQPYRMQIRITPDWLDSLTTFCSQLSQIDSEIFCCCSKLWNEDAFLLSAFPDEFNPLNMHMYDSIEGVLNGSNFNNANQAESNAKPPLSVIDELINSSQMNKVKGIDVRYKEMMSELPVDIRQRVDLTEEGERETIEELLFASDKHDSAAGRKVKKNLNLQACDELMRTLKRKHTNMEQRDIESVKNRRLKIKQRAYDGSAATQGHHRKWTNKNGKK